MGTKFTPGPWEVDDVNPFRVQDSGTGDEIVSTEFASEKSRVEQYANAHLSASAPDLYEALEAVESEILLDGQLQELVSNALAKARGEEL